MSAAINPYGDVQIGGSSTSTLGFYGATPIVKPSVTHIATTVISQVATSGKWAFSTSTAALALVSKVLSLQTKLDALGLITKS